MIPTLNNIHNASGNDVIYGLRGKGTANISRFGGRRKLKPGSRIFLILFYLFIIIIIFSNQIKESELGFNSPLKDKL